MDVKMEQDWQDTKPIIEFEPIKLIKEEVTDASDCEELIHKCEVCARRFSERADFDIHMGTHAKSDFHPCLKCRKAFATKEFLDIHLQRHTGDTKDFNAPSTEIEIYKCFICSKIFMTKRFLETHMTKHDDESHKLQTDIYSTQSARNLKRHMTKHEDKSHKLPTKTDSTESAKNLKRRELMEDIESPYRCSLCGKSFGNNVLLQGHKGKHRWLLNLWQQELKKKEQLPLDRTCSVCGKSFRSQREFLAHCKARGHKEEQGNKFKCPFCGKSCDASDDLVSHLETHRKLIENQPNETSVGREFDRGNCSETSVGEWNVTAAYVDLFKCAICSEHFPNKRCYLEHLNVHPGKNRHKCPECLSCFLTASQLRTHTITQHQDKLSWVDNHKLRYKCVKCNLKFPTYGALNEHKGSHVYLKCLYCTASCNTFDDLVAHLNTHTETAQEMSCKCSVCEQQFINKEVMEIHHKSHVKGGRELTHQCLTCGLRFSSASELNGHSAVHLFNKSVKCSLCTQFCSTKEELALHMENHESVKRDVAQAEGMQTADLTSHVNIKRGNPKRKKAEMHLEKVLDSPGCKNNEHLPVVCKICGLRFHSLIALNGHKGMHRHAQQTSNIYTSFSDAEFTHGESEESHQKRHVKEKDEKVKGLYDKGSPFTCITCGKCFQTLRALNGHKGVHSLLRKCFYKSSAGKKDNQESLFMCMACGNSFHNQYGLNGHKGQCPLLKDA